MKLSYSSSELASSMFFSVHQSIFFLCMFVPEGVQTMFLFLSKTSIFPFLFSVLILHSFQIYLPPAFPFPMLTSVSRGRRRDSLRSNRRSHSLLDTLPYYCWLPQPIPTSSPDISSTLHTGHTNHPATTPPPNKFTSPDRRARTAQQSARYQHHTTSRTSGAERNYHWQRAKRKTPRIMQQQQQWRTLCTRQKSARVALPCPCFSRLSSTRVHAPSSPIHGRCCRRCPVPPVSTSWVA